MMRLSGAANAAASWPQEGRSVTTPSVLEYLSDEEAIRKPKRKKRVRHKLTDIDYDAAPDPYEGHPFVKIPLTHGQFALVSPEDVIRLAELRWVAQRKGPLGRWYAVAHPVINGKMRTVYMSRFILGLGQGDKITGDHKNEERTLDNRRINLREANQKQQTRNRSMFKNNTTGFRGVYERSGRYRAGIRIDGKLKWIGTFDTKEEAARKFDVECLLRDPEFNQLNFPRSDYEPGGIAYIDGEVFDSSTREKSTERRWCQKSGSE